MDMLLGILQGLAIFAVGPVLVGLSVVGFILLWGLRADAQKKNIRQLTCSTDADCPEGYICQDGICISATPQVAK